MQYIGLIAVGIAMGLAALGSALGQGRAAESAAAAISRQPEVSGDIRTTLIIALAFMEALTLFTFVLAILMLGKIS
ncbi:MAG: ATP synthase F0 subunit C [Syntrophothermus sp.]